MANIGAIIMEANYTYRLSTIISQLLNKSHTKKPDFNERTNFERISLETKSGPKMEELKEDH